MCALGARLRISVASYNIHKCLCTDGRFDPDRILAVLLELDAEIIALQEADMRFGDRRGLLDLAALHHRGGYSAVNDVGLRETSHGFHGNVVLYRQGIVMGGKSTELPGLEPRGAELLILILAAEIFGSLLLILDC
jgi:endonuclease/exonuclease/phosphatase family metal-dependent hydrolase